MINETIDDYQLTLFPLYYSESENIVRLFKDKNYSLFKYKDDTKKCILEKWERKTYSRLNRENTNIYISFLKEYRKEYENMLNLFHGAIKTCQEKKDYQSCKDLKEYVQYYNKLKNICNHLLGIYGDETQGQKKYSIDNTSYTIIPKIQFSPDLAIELYEVITRLEYDTDD